MSLPNRIRRGLSLAFVKITPPSRTGKPVRELAPSEIAKKTPHKGGLRNLGGNQLARYFGNR